MEYKFNDKKLWTTFEIIIVENEWKDKEINDNMFLIWKYIDEFEQEFSRFRDNSQLTNLNNQKNLNVSRTFLDILAKSMNLYRFTNKYFNPLLNLKNLWYSHSFAENNFEILLENQDLNLEEINIVWENIVLKENQNIDFWWIAKWYLVDKLDEKLSDFWYTNYLVNAWWDIYMKWLNNENEKWVIWIENPYEQWYIWTVSLSDISISTSGSYKRHWKIKWEDYHHIVNPYTWKNENSLIWITIISSKCYISDSLATAIFSMWIDKWKEFMLNNWIDWILFWSNKSIFLTPNFTKKYTFTNL